MLWQWPGVGVGDDARPAPGDVSEAAARGRDGDLRLVPVVPGSRPGMTEVGVDLRCCPRCRPGAAGQERDQAQRETAGLSDFVADARVPGRLRARLAAGCAVAAIGEPFEHDSPAGQQFRPRTRGGATSPPLLLGPFHVALGLARGDVAMSGELTFTGTVESIGGITAKVLGAVPGARPARWAAALAELRTLLQDECEAWRDEPARVPGRLPGRPSSSREGSAATETLRRPRT